MPSHWSYKLGVRMGFRRTVALTIFLLGLASVTRAQDARVVTEPRLPQICKILYAELTPKNGLLPEEPIERHYRDNDRITKAMQGCPAGKAVVLHASKNGKSVFLISPLHLRAGVTLVVDATAAVWGSRDPRNYDVTPGSCGIVGERGPGCLPLILAEDAPHAGIMGEGVIDGRGGAKLIGLNETWWELAHRAKVEDSNQAVSRILVVRRSPDFTLYRITLRNSPSCHVSTEQTSGFTAWGVHIDTPKWARNTDGIDPQAGSSNISIIDSWIRSGDDNISPKSTAAGAVTHMTVRNTHFYNGHGFGIGSQTSGGLSAIRVEDLTIDGSDNGLRIKSDKSRGGLVDDVRFDNVCMRNVGNPIVLTPFYTTFAGDKIPVYRNIVLRNVHSLGAGPLTIAGFDAAHRLEATFDNVVVDGVRASDITSRHAILTIRHGNLEPGGSAAEDVRVSGTTGGEQPYSCIGKFVPFEVNMVSPISAELTPPADETFYVAADGTGDYYSVQSALNRVPQTGGLVLVAPGTYRERVLVKQNHVTLKSTNQDARKTVIVFDLSKGTQGSKQGIATVRVRGDDFVAENITFENDFNRTHKQENQGSQAQALWLAGDRNVLRNVRILGNQYTLYVGAKDCGQASGNPCEAGRSYFSTSYIAGNVDFIYGDGIAYFDDCEIHSIERAQGGFITAQGKHYANQESLFVFRNAKLTAEPGVTKVFLGRPWRDYATVIFLSPQLGSHIASPVWHEWQAGMHRLDTAFYRVFNPIGPAPQSRMLTPQEAARYTPKEVLAGKDGWDPAASR
jgi:polygalacturonase